MAFLDDLLKKIRKPLQAIDTPEERRAIVSNATNRAITGAKQYFDPTSNQGRNFWSTPPAK